MDDGWVKVYRKMLESAVWSDDNMLRVWMWLLLRSAHTEQRILMNGKELVVPVGGVVSGRDAGSRECRMKPSTFRNTIARLERLGMISQKSDNKKTLYVVEKYSTYQGSRTTKGQQKDNRRTTGGHIQECKNDECENTSVEKWTDQDKLNTQNFVQAIETIRPGCTKGTKLEKWYDEFRKIRTLDKRTQEEIDTLTSNLHKSAFWSKNVQSPKALRGELSDGRDRFTAILSDVSKQTAPQGTPYQRKD